MSNTYKKIKSKYLYAVLKFLWNIDIIKKLNIFLIVCFEWAGCKLGSMRFYFIIGMYRFHYMQLFHDQSEKKKPLCVVMWLLNPTCTHMYKSKWVTSYDLPHLNGWRFFFFFGVKWWIVNKIIAWTSHICPISHIC